MERAASATALPCAVSTSTWRGLATISSGVCVLFLPIDEPPSASASHITGGPLLGGQVSPLRTGAHDAERRGMRAVLAFGRRRGVRARVKAGTGA